MAKQFKTHCKIIDYVESVEPELARLIKGVCADQSLLASRNKPGVTFLMPGKDLIKKISELAYSSNIDDADKANDMINNLIIKDIFRTPGEWMTHKDDIPNSLYPSQHIEIDSVTPTEVIFKSKARATLDSGFNPSKDKFNPDKRLNLAVWKLTGEIPITKDKPSSGKYKDHHKQQGKSGGYIPVKDQMEGLRFLIRSEVENKYFAACSIRSKFPRRVYCKYYLSLIDWMMNNGHNKLASDILPILSFDAVDFYILFEPDRVVGNMLIPNDIINGWWESKNYENVDINGIINTIQNILKNNKDQAAVYKNRAGLINEINNISKNIYLKTSSKPRTLPDTIAVEYGNLENNNKIGQINNVYPEYLANFYRENAGLKMLHDEMRYYCCAAFNNFEQRPDVGDFHAISNFIAECTHAGTSEERKNILRLLNSKIIKYQIAPEARVRELQSFLCSGLFLYILLTEEETKTLKQMKKPHYIEVPDFRAIIYNMHTFCTKSVKTGSNEHKMTAEDLRKINFEDLPEDVIEELRKKLANI